MKHSHLTRMAGMFALIATLLAIIKVTLILMPDKPPQISDAEALKGYLTQTRLVILTKVLTNTLIFICTMFFFAGFKHMIYAAGKGYEWLGTLNFGAACVWWSVTLVANGLEGSAALNTIGGEASPAVLQSLIGGTLLMYYGPMYFAPLLVIMSTTAYAIQTTKILPSWLAWMSWAIFLICIAFIPSMYNEVLDSKKFYNAAGWGPNYATLVPILIWFISMGFGMIWDSFDEDEDRVYTTPVDEDDEEE